MPTDVFLTVLAVIIAFTLYLSVVHYNLPKAERETIAMSYILHPYWQTVSYIVVWTLFWIALPNLR